MSQRIHLCAVTVQALPQVKAEFERQGFYNFEVYINDQGRLVLTAEMGAKPNPTKSPKRKRV